MTHVGCCGILRNVLATAFSAALSGFALLVAAAPDDDGVALRSGEPAPLFQLKTMNPELSGRTLFSLAKHVGERSEEPKAQLVLSFAASYCEPCKKELAELVALGPRLSKGDILLAVVVIDTEPEGIESMRRLVVDELKLPFPVLADRFGVVARRYRAKVLPYVVIVDRSGVVRWSRTGFEEGALGEMAEKLGI